MHEDWFSNADGRDKGAIRLEEHSMNWGCMYKQRVEPWEQLRRDLVDRTEQVQQASPQALAAVAIFLTFNHNVSPFSYTCALCALVQSLMSTLSATAAAWKLHDMPIYDLKSCSLNYPKSTAFTTALPQALAVWSSIAFVATTLPVAWISGSKTWACVFLIIFLTSSRGIGVLVASIILGKRIDARGECGEWCFTGDVDNVRKKKRVIVGQEEDAEGNSPSPATEINSHTSWTSLALSFSGIPALYWFGASEVRRVLSVPFLPI
ncbi:hypothetical protein FRB96_007919 [Tulasnella sp. 330]|nr:hypothetical protein FRB96_007919 [Tulasnella sp. 330]